MTASFSGIPSGDISLTWSIEPSVTVSVSLANIAVTNDDGVPLGTLGNLNSGTALDTNNSIFIIWGDSTSGTTPVPVSTLSASHKYTQPGVYTIKVYNLSVLTTWQDEYGQTLTDYTNSNSTVDTVIDLTSNPEWELGWQAQPLTQPQASGSDGYGAIRGSTLRRDLIQPFPAYDSVAGVYGPLPATQVVLHQINTAQANPQIYTRAQTVAAGQQWRVSCEVPSNPGIAVAGITEFKWSVDWYNSSGTYLSSTDGDWLTSAGDVVGTNGTYPGTVFGRNNVWRPRHTVTVPSGATKMIPTLQMKTLSAVNAWSPCDFKYEKLITA